MSEENLTNPGNNLEPTEPQEEFSASDAMAGVFTSPGETFETIAVSPKKNYWIIPVLITVVIGLIVAFLFMQDAELARNTMDKQKKKMQERFEQNIKEGKMTQEEADKAMENMNPKGIVFKLFGFGGAVIGPFVILFILSGLYFIILKIMKSPVEFANILNVVGLAMLITAVGSILGIVISILKGSMSGIGLGLFLNEETVGEKIYALLTKLDLFYIWFYIVVAIGLSKVAKINMAKAVSITFGIFILYAVVTSIVF
jgi:Yip1 domain